MSSLGSSFINYSLHVVLRRSAQNRAAAKTSRASDSGDLRGRGEPNQDEVPNGDESGPKDAVWVGGGARPQVKRGKVLFRRASNEEKRHFPALRGDLPSALRRGESVANRRQESVLISALAEKVKGSRPSGQAQPAFAG